MRIYRGDTFPFNFSASQNDGTPYVFKTGEILKVGIKNRISSTEYQLFQKKQIEEDTQVVPFEFSHEEMMKLSLGTKILEFELRNTLGKVSTLYQEEIEIVGDVINE